MCACLCIYILNTKLKPYIRFEASDIFLKLVFSTFFLSVCCCFSLFWYSLRVHMWFQFCFGTTFAYSFRFRVRFCCFFLSNCSEYIWKNIPFCSICWITHLYYIKCIKCMTRRRTNTANSKSQQATRASYKQKWSWKNAVKTTRTKKNIWTWTSKKMHTRNHKQRTYRGEPSNCCTQM